MARASGWTILSKLSKLVGLIVIVGVLAAGFLIPYIGGIGLAAKAGADKFLNTQCTLTEEPVQQKTTMYANDGKTVIATLFDQNRQVISLTKVPKAVTNALISTEDRRFYSHHGVDMRGLIRGALKTSNGDTQGASTLTEQYVKQVRYYEARTDAERAAAIDQNIDRKIQDAQCALKIERENSKSQILEKYLNIAFFGESAYGIQTAAQTFFGVDASKLTVPQAALLIGLVKAPSDFDPFQHPQAARDRRDLVIDNMASQNYISAAQAASYKASPVKLAPHSTPPRGCAFANPNIKNVGFFCDYALSWLTKTGGLTAQRINTSGLKIVTTLDPGLQNSGQTAIWADPGGPNTLDPKNPYLLAMPSVDPRSGRVTSMITDKYYGVKAGNPAYTTVPIFTQAFAGSGSTYKYFTTLAAMKLGVPASYQLTAGDPYHTKNCPAGTDPKPDGYRNAGNYRATYPLSQALPLSSNTYFIAMEDQLFGCDLAPIVDTATSLGMNYLTDPTVKDDPSGRTIAQATIQDHAATFTLGQRSTSVLELTGAFGAVANDGVFCPPTPILSVTDTTGKAVSFKRPGCSRQFDSYTARTLVNIMVNDTNPSGTGGTSTGYFGNWYGNGGSQVAGKTGTNNSCVYDAAAQACVDDGKNSALWFVGITPTLVSAAALVNPDKPTLTIANVPGVTANNDGRDTFGATAARFWLESFAPTLQSQPWSWPTVDSTPGNPVLPVTGMDVNTATTSLTGQGYKVKVVTTFTCGSKEIQGNVAFYGPHVAEPGSTITLCLSSGVAPTLSLPPVKPTKSRGGPTGFMSPPASGGPTSAPTRHPGR
ncbi:MAG: penicillin-binding protein [Actinomycetota bacterium]|nr:penicillin-binding protein [Actinomycetota bacterium]MDQ2957744.1 penicillin-binding protein [Actinomycetota bacterium]